MLEPSRTQAEPGRTRAPGLDDPRWQHRCVDLNGVRLHYVEAGQGPLVVLLHGFPEFWYAWRQQIQQLAAAGFRVFAPDLRGFNFSGKPPGVSAYGLRAVVDDVHALIQSAGVARASLVGHDIGAGVAWGLAMRHPTALERLVIVNGPHPARMLLGLLNPRQLLRSWYIFFLQLPWLPEVVARARDHALLLEPFERIPAAARWSREEYDAYRRAFEQPGALHAMINYYRAMARPTAAVRLQRIEAPVLVLWGDRDPYLGRSLAEPSKKWVPRAQVEYLAGVGHFVQHEQPELLNRRIVEFLNQAEGDLPCRPEPKEALHSSVKSAVALRVRRCEWLLPSRRAGSRQ
jgi:pimeloyl-ACP methyl ester carboxylesterase